MSKEIDLTDPANLAQLQKNFQVPSPFSERSSGPLNDLEIEEIDNFSRFLDRGAETANQLRTLGEAKAIWKETLSGEDNVIYLGISGDMVTAGMTPVIRYAIEKRLVDVVFSQGANLFHDFARTVGYERIKTFPQQFPDSELFQKSTVRMYDVLEPSEAQVFSSVFVAHVAKRMVNDGYEIVTTRQFYHYIGKMLYEWNLVKKEGILTTCYRQNVPIFVAGPESSATALDLAAAQNKAGIPLEIGVGRELIDHAMLQDKIENLGLRSNLIEIGGGVVRNTLQQIATASYIVRGEPFSMEEPEWFKKHLNAILITTDTGVHFGGASAVPLREYNPSTQHPQGENLSWGKFDPEGKRVTVIADATIVLPLLVKSLIDDPETREILGKRKPVKFSNLEKFPLDVAKTAQ